MGVKDTTPSNDIRHLYEYTQTLRNYFEIHVWGRQQTNYDAKFIVDFNSKLMSLCNQVYELTQAEITGDIAFKAGVKEGKAVTDEQIEADEDVANLNRENGKQEGIKLVEDWVNNNHVKLQAENRTEGIVLKQLLIDKEEWQAFLKLIRKSGKPSSKRRG